MTDPTKQATAVSEFRLRWLRLYYGAADEHSDASVPEENRDSFRQHVQYNEEQRAQWFEEACKVYGAANSMWEGVAEERHVEALRDIGETIARYNNNCEFELDLFKIDQEAEFDYALTPHA